MDLRHHVDAVDQDLLALGSPQRDVEHRSVFGDVDLLAPEHGRDSLFQTGPAGERDQQLHCLCGQPVLGIVEQDPVGFDRQLLAARRVLGEQLPQMPLTHRFEVLAERLPLAALGDRALDDGLRHRSPPTCGKVRPCWPEGLHHMLYSHPRPVRAGCTAK